MELDKIEQVLEKYFEGNTSVAEEKELKHYFASNQVAPHLEQYKTIFDYCQYAKQEKFKDRISVNKNQLRVIKWLPIAASVLLLASIGLIFYKSNQKHEIQNVGTVNDPKVAFRETQKALDLVSKQLNKGLESVNYLNEYEQTKNKIFIN